MPASDPAFGRTMLSCRRPFSDAPTCTGPWGPTLSCDTIFPLTLNFTGALPERNSTFRGPSQLRQARRSRSSWYSGLSVSM